MPRFAVLLVLLAATASCRSTSSSPPNDEDLPPLDDESIVPPVTCAEGSSAGPVAAPEFVRNFGTETGWYASPLVVDLDGNGSNEIVSAAYSTFVYDSVGTPIDQAVDGGSSRVFAPHVVADLEKDGKLDIVVGRGKYVVAWEWSGNQFALKSGFPFDTTTGSAPEVRGLAVGDLDGDGQLEIVATTTQTTSTASGGAQVFALTAAGAAFQPAGGHSPAWPRYNALTGTGNDADRNGAGHSGYGAYGLNVGIGQLDDDGALEIVATYDNHFIQAFNHDGVAIDSARPTSPIVTTRM
jgi:hypothetical protein